MLLSQRTVKKTNLSTENMLRVYRRKQWKVAVIIIYNRSQNPKNYAFHAKYNETFVQKSCTFLLQIPVLYRAQNKVAEVSTNREHFLSILRKILSQTWQQCIHNWLWPPQLNKQPVTKRRGPGKTALEQKGGGEGSGDELEQRRVQDRSFTANLIFNLYFLKFTF